MQDAATAAAGAVLPRWASVGDPPHREGQTQHSAERCTVALCYSRSDTMLVVHKLAFQVVVDGCSSWGTGPGGSS